MWHFISTETLYGSNRSLLSCHSEEDFFPRVGVSPPPTDESQSSCFSTDLIKRWSGKEIIFKGQRAMLNTKPRSIHWHAYTTLYWTQTHRMSWLKKRVNHNNMSLLPAWDIPIFWWSSEAFCCSCGSFCKHNAKHTQAERRVCLSRQTQGTQHRCWCVYTVDV